MLGAGWEDRLFQVVLSRCSTTSRPETWLLPIGWPGPHSHLRVPMPPRSPSGGDGRRSARSGKAILLTSRSWVPTADSRGSCFGVRFMRCGGRNRRRMKPTSGPSNSLLPLKIRFWKRRHAHFEPSSWRALIPNAHCMTPGWQSSWLGRQIRIGGPRSHDSPKPSHSIPAADSRKPLRPTRKRFRQFRRFSNGRQRNCTLPSSPFVRATRPAPWRCSTTSSGTAWPNVIFARPTSRSRSSADSDW